MCYQRTSKKVRNLFSSIPEDTIDIAKVAIFVKSLTDRWWGWQDSNLRPTGYEPAALPLSYDP